MNAEQLVIAWAFSYAVCNTPIIPRVGQVWPVESDTTISVYEIAGFQESLIHYYPWIQKKTEEQFFSFQYLRLYDHTLIEELFALIVRALLYTVLVNRTMSNFLWRNDFKWIKAHPEKTTSVAKFTNKQLGIYIAGAI